MIYREATIEDVFPQGLGLVTAGMAEVNLGEDPVCEASALRTMYRLVEDPNCLVAVAEDQGQLVGVVVASLSQSLFSNSTYTTLHVWYVLPEVRGSLAGYRLARIYRDWAVLVGAKTAYCDVNSCVNNELAGRMVERLGFKRIGDAYKATF